MAHRHESNQTDQKPKRLDRLRLLGKKPAVIASLGLVILSGSAEILNSGSESARSVSTINRIYVPNSISRSLGVVSAKTSEKLDRIKKDTGSKYQARTEGGADGVRNYSSIDQRVEKKPDSEIHSKHAASEPASLMNEPTPAAPEEEIAIPHLPSPKSAPDEAQPPVESQLSDPQHQAQPEDNSL